MNKGTENRSTVNDTTIGSRVEALLGAGLLTLLVVLALSGCAGATRTGGGSSTGGSGTGGPGSPRDITGTWQLVSGTDATGAITPRTALVTFTFNGESSGGRGPCNSFGAIAEGTTTGTTRIVVGIHTEMACVDPDLNTTESRYFAALGQITKAALDDGTLTLTGGGDSLVFTRATQ